MFSSDGPALPSKDAENDAANDFAGGAERAVVPPSPDASPDLARSSPDVTHPLPDASAIASPDASAPAEHPLPDASAGASPDAPAPVDASADLQPAPDTTLGPPDVPVDVARTGYNLNVARVGGGGGTIISAPPGIDCGSICSSTFDKGTVVTLTATPNANSAFTGWLDVCTGTGTCSVTMDESKSVTAGLVAKYDLAVVKTGAGGGTVKSWLAGIDCGSTCSARYADRTAVTLIAIPDATSTFAGWSGLCLGRGICTVTVNQTESVTASFVVGPIIQVTAGREHSCALKSDGTIVCWGSNNGGESSPPAGSFVSVSAGFDDTCGLKSDGSIACWGNNDNGQATPPLGVFTAVSVGWNYACGLKSDGSIVCWGNSDNGQTTPPVGPFVSVSAGALHACGLKDDGSIACWGSNDNGESTPPAGVFVSVSAGSALTCGLKGDGSAACWGSSPTVGLGPFGMVSAAQGFACGLRSSGGGAVCWGTLPADPIAGGYVLVSAAYAHVCAVKFNNGIACWGGNDHGESTVPDALR